MLVLDNAHKNNIGKLFSILNKHPNKATSPELVEDGILILIKYTNDTDLESIIRQRDTTISVPFYYTAYFPTHVYENIIYMIKFFFLLYTISAISYVG
jgi:hypothetical protein